MAAVAQLKLNATPGLMEVLRRASEIVSRPQMLHEAIAHTVVNGSGRQLGVQRHIMRAATTRHKTAKKLGATPTGYLEKAAQNIEANGTAHEAKITINNSSGIFSRTFGPVTIVPGGGKKWLAIPMHASAYGKSPLNFRGRLDFVKVSNTLALWFLRDTPKAEGPLKPNKPATAKKAAKAKKATKASDKPKTKRQLMFIGKPSVTQPQDRGLLPSDEDFRELIAAGADNAVALELEAIKSRWSGGGNHPPIHTHL